MQVTVAADGLEPALLERFHAYAVSHHSATAARQAELVTALQAELVAFARGKGYQLKDNQPPLVVGYQQPALVKELGAVTRRVMDYQGWQNEPANSDFVVSIDAAYGRFDFLVPHSIRTNPEAQGTYVEPSDALGGRPVPTAGAGTNLDRAGSPAHRYVHAIAAHVYPADNPQGTAWWSGTIVAITDVQAFNRVAPQLIDELMREFPKPTGQAPTRTVFVER